MESMKQINQKKWLAAGIAFLLPICSSCSEPTIQKTNNVQEEPLTVTSLPTDAYRSYYEIFPYSFADSNGDGIGDLNGITEVLDYINDGDAATKDDLGMTGIWLTPIMPAVSYHKYDVTDYMNVDPQFGTMNDFDNLVTASHQRGIRVILDLVLNHTSDEHPWFQQAASYLRSIGDQEPSSVDCPYVDYYHLSKENKDGYHLLSGTDWYYESRFWEGMPDLNLDSDAVWQQIDTLTSFWLSHGVDGFRLDAAKEYYTGSDTQNIQALTRLNTLVKGKKKDAYIVAEVWMNRDSYAKYYSSGIDSVFDFAFANSDGNIASLVKGSINASQYTKALLSEEEMYAANNPSYINAPFYTNHDMGRGAGYYSGVNAAAMEKFALAMNQLQGGASFTYYGEELGMKGSGKDENKRAPMDWGDGTYQKLTCKGPQNMDAGIEMINGSLSQQETDDTSIYQYYKKVIDIRNQLPVIARGKTAWIEQENSAVGILTKKTEQDSVCIVFNPTDQEQTVSKEAVLKGAKSDADLNKAVDLLLTDSDAVRMEGDHLILPAYSIVLYQ